MTERKRTKLPESAPLEAQMKQTIENKKEEVKKEKEYDGNFGSIIHTGSTLLDLAISGGRIHGGGLPGGIFIEAFGPSGAGKSALLSQVAGNIQSQGGEVMFHDPEARLNQQFAMMFGLQIKEDNYLRPNTITELFRKVQKWEPPYNKKRPVHGVIADSLAALSTEMEMKEDGEDKMGARRAKEFSQELRKTCRILAEQNYIMLCSNQIRDNVGVTFGEKTSSPGGKALAFYSSLRLKFHPASKIFDTVTFNGKEIKRPIGVQTEIEVYKSSIWKPFRTATISIIFDYGIDDIRENLQYLKDMLKTSVYTLDGNQNLNQSLEKSIKMVEKDNLEEELREAVIGVWETIEDKFDSERKPKF